MLLYIYLTKVDMKAFDCKLHCSTKQRYHGFHVHVCILFEVFLHLVRPSVFAGTTGFDSGSLLLRKDPGVIKTCGIFFNKSVLAADKSKPRKQLYAQSNRDLRNVACNGLLQRWDIGLPTFILRSAGAAAFCQKAASNAAHHKLLWAAHYGKS